MEKLMPKVQKYVFLLALVSLALLALYTLVCATPAACCLLGPNINGVKPGEVFFEEFSATFNLPLLYFVIAGFICYFIFVAFNSKNRKIYYLSNFIAPIIFVVFAVALTVFALPQIATHSATYNGFLNDGFFETQNYVIMGAWYVDNTFLIDIGYLPIFLILISSLLILAVAVYKFVAQKKAKKEAE